MDEQARYTIQLKKDDEEGAATEQRQLELRELLDVLRHVDAEVDAHHPRDTSEGFGLGNAIEIAFGASAIVAVARGIAEWFSRHRTASIYLKRHDGTEIELSAKDTDRIQEFFSNNLSQLQISVNGNRSVQISGDGNIVIGGRVVGVEPVEPWPQPGKPRK